MTKRFGSDLENKQSKKLKTDDNLDDLWGDDLDAKDVDDCFMLATQVWEQPANIPCTQRNNVSILPGYNVFREKTSKHFTSTQSNPELDYESPSTSKVITNHNKFHTTNRKECTNTTQENGFKRVRSFETSDSQLNIKFKKLEEQFHSKEGEISILRAQLKDVRKKNEEENSKRQKELTEKITTTAKQLNVASTELKFKNLEIANLKQKIIEVAKLNYLDTSLNSTQSPYFKHSDVTEKRIPAASTLKNKEINIGTHKIEFISKLDFPLQQTIDASIFNLPVQEKYSINLKHGQVCRTTIPFLQNQLSEELIERLTRLQPKTTSMLNGRGLNIDYIYSDLMTLMKSTSVELMQEKSRVHINKVVCVSEQLLYNLNLFLSELQHRMVETSTSKVNVIYLEDRNKPVQFDHSIYDSRHWCTNELGVAARQALACVAAIVPHSQYLQEYLQGNAKLIFCEEEITYLSYLPCIKPKLVKEYCNNRDYLQLVLSLTKFIRKLRKNDILSGFLAAVVALLNEIYLCTKLKSNDIVFEIVKEIIFTCPNAQVICPLLKLMKNVSAQTDFVGNLCRLSPRNCLKFKDKEQVLYYKQDVCVLQMLCVSLECSFKQAPSEMFLLYLNVVGFFLNCFKGKHSWLYYQEDKHCDCLSKIVKLGVDVIYRAVEKIISNEFTGHSHALCEIIKSGINLLHVFNFKAGDVIIKYILTYSQFKVIVKRLLEYKEELNLTETYIEILEELNVTEELLPNLKNSKSATILWDQL